MKTFFVILILTATICCLSFSLRQEKEYHSFYDQSLSEFKQAQNDLKILVSKTDLSNDADIKKIKEQIHSNRKKLKAIDFWLRYFEPIAYRKINGPLPVEWENEVFEKFEPPYRRQGGGLILAELYLDEEVKHKDSLLSLLDTSLIAIQTFEADSITSQLNSYNHFFLANRLFLLNLAAIYTTGFECPDTSNIIPELQAMLPAVKKIYSNYDISFSPTPLSKEYLLLYEKTIEFVNQQSQHFSLFDHFLFIKRICEPTISDESTVHY